MDKINLLIESTHLKRLLNTWFIEKFPKNQISTINSLIWIIEVNNFSDWLRIIRLQKKNPEFYIVPLLDDCMLHSVQLICHLKQQFLLIKPVKKHVFLRTMKRVIESITPFDDIKPDYVRESFLRRLLSGEKMTANELISAEILFPDQEFPNVVYFLQGFIYRVIDSEVDRITNAQLLIQQYLEEKLKPILKNMYFIPFHNHLALMSRVPHLPVSLRDWAELTDALLKAIEQLKKDHNIYIYVGVGSVVKESQLLYNSYLQARKARHTPPSRTMTVRFFEEISRHVTLQKCISYIGHHYNENLSIGIVAEHSNLSYNYFSRLFNKETGMSFVDYVTFVRLQRAVWMLRHSDKTIEKIAEETGFNTPNYFSCIFKKNVGLSPSEYRTTQEIYFR